MKKRIEMLRDEKQKEAEEYQKFSISIQRSSACENQSLN